MILCPCDPEPDRGGDIIPETAGGTGETFRMPPDTAAPSELDEKMSSNEAIRYIIIYQKEQ